MKRLIERILIILIILIIIDFSFGFIFKKILVSSPDGRYYKAYYSLLECKEDIIIFGSSRAETNYAPFVFEDSLKLSCWNTGRGGQTLPFWDAMKKGVLSRYTPKIAIINVEYDFLSLNLNENSFEHAGFLRPFYNLQPEIKPIINKISKFERIKMYSKIYAYNSSFYYLFRPYLIKGIDGKKEDKGWKTKEGEVYKSELGAEIIETNKKFNNETVTLFEKFIEDLTSKGCEVYVILSPNYNIIIKSTSTLKYLKAKKNIHLINYSDDVFFSSNPSFFKDQNHLNIKGALEFSKRVSAELKVDFATRNNKK